MELKSHVPTDILEWYLVTAKIRVSDSNGVRRWGTNLDGSVSKSDIDLFKNLSFLFYF